MFGSTINTIKIYDGRAEAENELMDMVEIIQKQPKREIQNTLNVHINYICWEERAYNKIKARINQLFDSLESRKKVFIES